MKKKKNEKIATISGKIYFSKTHWIVEIPSLDLMAQAENIDGIYDIIVDLISTKINDANCEIDINIFTEMLLEISMKEKDHKKLIKNEG